MFLDRQNLDGLNLVKFCVIFDVVFTGVNRPSFEIKKLGINCMCYQIDVERGMIETRMNMT